MSLLAFPQVFSDNMKRILGPEYEAFETAFSTDVNSGLRLNPLKPVNETLTEFGLTPVPWAAEGYYFDVSTRPGRHVLHAGGAYYIQEPSAMSAVSVLDPRPGECVLDLCAAPGGKSTQIAGRLMGRGLLISNEIIPSRADILSENIERMGIRNAVVLNESPASLSSRFPSFFDRILVDAPCSGEGMFRKEEHALSEWSPENVRLCAERQSGILDEAARMLKPGGVLVYSTCTFNLSENEGVINAFLKDHPEFSIEESPLSVFFSPGRPDLIEDGDPGLAKTMRLFPHKLKGEGHYAARLKKAGESDAGAFSCGSTPGKAGKELKEFLKNEVRMKSDAVESLFESTSILEFGDMIYLVPGGLDLRGLKVKRPGLHIAVKKKNRLEPAHSLAMALRRNELEAVLEADLNDAEKYLHGESLYTDLPLTGWTVVTYKGISLGFSKISGGSVKNHYPKGLRTLF